MLPAVGSLRVLQMVLPVSGTKGSLFPAAAEDPRYVRQV